jgi:RHS repeat-associated protein
MGSSTYYTYDETGNRTSMTNRRGFTTNYQYDAMSRITRRTDPLGNHTFFYYDNAGNRTGFTDPNGNTTTLVYNPLNRMISLIDPLSNSETYVYDPVGNLVSRTDKMGKLTAYGYDGNSRLTTATDALGLMASRTYDQEGNTLSETDRNGHTRTYEYDALDRRIQSTNPMGFTTLYYYDENSNLVEYKDASSNSRNYQYDALDRRIVSQTPMGFTTYYFYDAMGNVTRMVDPNNDTIKYFYNENRRVTRVLYPDGSEVKTTFDTEMLPLQLVSISPFPDTITMSYDSRNFPASVTKKYSNLFQKTTEFTYDANGNRTKIVHGLDTMEYTYDVLSRVTRLVDPVNDTVEYQYNPSGLRTLLEMGPGTTAHYDYDDIYRLTALTWLKSSSDTLVSYQYAYDFENNKLSRIEKYPLPSPSFQTTYAYDLMDRLVLVNNSWGGMVQYGYDSVSNRIAKNETGNVTNYFYDADNRLNAEIPMFGTPTNYLYDNNGNLAVKQAFAGPTTYDYDHENRLIQVSPPDASPVSYDYSAAGQKMSRTASPPEFYDYVCFYCEGCCQWYCVPFYRYGSDGSDTSRITPGNFMDEHLKICTITDTNYLVSDGNGSITMALDQSEDIVASWEYDEFGNIISHSGSSPNDHNFQGKENDAISGLYDFVNRQYDPQMGRFTGQDPLFTGQVSHCAGGCYDFQADIFGSAPQAHFSDDPSALDFFDPGSDPFIPRPPWWYKSQINAPQDYINDTPESPSFFGPGSEPFQGDPNWKPPKPKTHGLPPNYAGSMENLYAFVNNNPVSFMDPLGLSYSSGNGRYSEAFGRGTCQSGSCNSCGSWSGPSVFPGSEPCFLGLFDSEPNGTASCDLSKPPCAGADIDINNKKCTKVCTEEHEKQHEKDMKNCCDKGRSAYGSVADKWADIYRGRGLGAKTLENKLKNLNKDSNVIKERNEVGKKWGGWFEGARAWTECNAHSVSVDCADRLWKEKNCDCPAPEDKECCKDIKEYKAGAEHMKKKYCGMKGAGKAPACPF